MIDVVRHDRMFATDFTGPNEGPASLTRFTIDLAAGKVREHRFDEHSQEFPRHDERLTGSAAPLRVRRRVRRAPRSATPCSSTTWSPAPPPSDGSGPGAEASEFCFVPSRRDAAEDDGVLMGYVHDRATGLSDLVLLDAGTLDDVAAVHLPGRVPAGFHGNWAPTA